LVFGVATVLCLAISTVGWTPPAAAAIRANPFACAEAAGVVNWTNHGQGKYWAYRSVDGGASYSWLGRTYGATMFVDSTAAPGYRYQVH